MASSNRKSSAVYRVLILSSCIFVIVSISRGTLFSTSLLPNISKHDDLILPRNVQTLHQNENQNLPDINNDHGASNNTTTTILKEATNETHEPTTLSFTTNFSKFIYKFGESTRANSTFSSLHKIKSTTNKTNEDNGPFLVICDTLELQLVPMFNNFTIIRLINGDAPPPWNATAFLQIMHRENCSKHPYVVESMQRLQASPRLSPEEVVPLPSSPMGESIDGVHWPHLIFLRAIRDRPAIIGFRGEVFWRADYGSCQDYDFIVYREKETPGLDCFTVHYLQGVSTSAVRKDEDGFGFEATRQILEGRVTHPHKPTSHGIKYVRFCSYIIKHWSGLNRPVHMFNTSHYDIDAIVRHIFIRQLGQQYKPCERYANCLGGLDPYNAFQCVVGSKFYITMENTLIDGYISEKIFNGALGGAIPIYFGAPDVANYLNTRSFVYCNVSKSVIEEMRSYYPRTERPRRFFFNNRTKSSPWPTDDELIEWASSYLAPELEPCVKRVMELDQDDVAFRQMLDEPFIENPDIMSGEYPLRGVEMAYNFLRNWKNFVE